MIKLLDFIRKERLYFLLIVFILLVNLIIAINHSGISKKADKVVSFEESVKDNALKRAEMDRVFEKDSRLSSLFTIASLVIFLLLLLGLVIDFVLFVMNFAGAKINIATYRMQAVKWGIWDVSKVVILFAFFGYILVMIESALIKIFPVIKNDNLRMIFNASILDVTAVALIIYFAVKYHKEKLISLGLSLKNFFRNVLYGVAGYIAAVPLLLAIVFLTSFVTNLIHYVPKEQAVLKLFMKEQDAAFLFYTTLFAAIVGPFIEELFFRGFMYNAVKKRAGTFWSIMITAGLFAALHAHTVGFLPIMVLGILLAYLYEKTGTLVAPVTVHILHNMNMVLLVMLMKQIKV